MRLVPAVLFFVAVPLAVAADDPPRKVPGAEDEIVVTATRLTDEPVPADEVPADTTVITREEIERSGARTVQEILSLETGAESFDEVGNGVQTTFDLRGFRGSGTAVFLDDVRINDPRNNALSLEAVPIDAVERIEIARGAASALAGGGSEAGVVRILTRGGSEPSLSVTAARGSDGAGRYGIAGGGSLGALDGFVSASRDATDGFRENAGGRSTRLLGRVGWEIAPGRRLDLTLSDADVGYGQPGALTRAEWDADPAQAPYNRLDRSDATARLAALSYRGKAGDAWSLVATVGFRDTSSEVLSTGRSAAIFGGFFLDADTTAWSGVGQATWTAGRSELALGFEALDGDVDARGWFTPPTDPGFVDRENPSAVNSVARRTSAIFAQETFRAGSRLTLVAGVRRDHDRQGYEESVPDPTLAGSRTFAETSLRAGAVVSPSDRWNVYASYGEAFLPPTAEDLFAFPGFGSNPDLEPEDARSIEAGIRAKLARGRAKLSVFSIDTRNEILFDPDSPLGLFGANVNAGRTRRRGAEASIEGRLAPPLRGWIRLTYVEAEFRGGADAGASLPLVPRERAAAGIDADLPHGFGVRVDVLRVGSQYLDNDDANAQAKLPAYTVVGSRLAWTPPTAGDRATLFVELRNLFDERYATRGIHVSESFFTPAPGRRVLAGLTWRR